MWFEREQPFLEGGALCDIPKKAAATETICKCALGSQINLVPSASVTLVQRNGCGRPWNDPNPETQNFGFG